MKFTQRIREQDDSIWKSILHFSKVKSIDVMEETFMISSRYEYSFWEMAYRLEEWPM